MILKNEAHLGGGMALSLLTRLAAASLMDARRERLFPVLVSSPTVSFRADKLFIDFWVATGSRMGKVSFVI